jgi:sigma-E factor negative regulatory protein RseA
MVKFGVTGSEDMQTAEPSHVLASDLADGRLDGDAFGHAVEIVCADPAGLRAWHMVHLVGDAMRSPELAGCCLDVAFAQAVQERLAAETFDPSPEAGFGPLPDAAPSAPLRAGPDTRGANDWNWTLVAGVAAVAVALSVVLSVGGLWTGSDGSASVAKSGVPVVPAAPVAPVELAPPAPVLASVPLPAASPQATPQVMIRDPRLDELLAAHRQLGGTSALQKPAGFFRSAAHQEEGSR